MIQVENLVKKYGGFTALKGISFHVQKGEVVGLLGANGAGKSTTMNILTGYISYTSGEVRIAGINNLEEPKAAKQCIGYLPEKPPVYMDMTVAEYLDFVCGLKRVPLAGRKRASHIDEICSKTGLEKVLGRRIGNLSKGYRQRVGFAQALVGSPDILILDEPTVGLDPEQIIEIRELIRSLSAAHCIMLSSHILSEVQSVCNRILIIHNGLLVVNSSTYGLAHAQDGHRRYRLRLLGEQAKLRGLLSAVPGVLSVQDSPHCEQDVCEFLISADDGNAVLQRLFYEAVAANAPVLGLEQANDTLEDIYIRIIRGEMDASHSSVAIVQAGLESGGTL